MKEIKFCHHAQMLRAQETWGEDEKGRRITKSTTEYSDGVIVTLELCSGGDWKVLCNKPLRFSALTGKITVRR
ncbi:MAG: hypothetical protein LBG46_06320 [Elusimicrobiota bacterium]|jgi:hypothetical protein|nr:hypothetical protein [Elusimicrobiota bacterium]